MMIAVLIGVSVVAGVFWYAGLGPDGHWRFAPLRATGMILGFSCRVLAVVAVFVFAVTLGVVVNAMRSAF